MMSGVDLVLSYVVSHRGPAEGDYQKVQEALASGYRVVDVLTNEMPPGPSSAGLGAVCVTVILTQQSPVTLPYKGLLQS
jgi:hypothetical protein